MKITILFVIIVHFICLRIKNKENKCELSNIDFEKNIIYDNDFYKKFQNHFTLLNNDDIEYIFKIIDDNKIGEITIKQWKSFNREYIKTFVEQDKSNQCLVENKNLAEYIFHNRINESFKYINENDFLFDKNGLFQMMTYIFSYVDKEISISERDVDTIITTFRPTYTLYNRETIIEICRIIKDYFKFGKSITEGLISIKDINDCFVNKNIHMYSIDYSMLKEGLKNIKDYFGFKQFALFEIIGKMFHLISSNGFTVKKNELKSYLKKTNVYNLDMPTFQENSYVNKTKSLFEQLSIENNNKKDFMNRLFIASNYKKYNKNELSFEEFIYLIKNIRLYKTLVNNEKNHLLNLSLFRNNNLLTSLLTKEEKELISVITLKIKCKQINIIQFCQISNYQKYWNEYLSYNSNPLILYKDIFNLLKQIGLEMNNENEDLSNIPLANYEIAELKFSEEVFSSINASCDK